MPVSQFEVMTASTFPYYLGISRIAISIFMLVLSLKNKHDENLSLVYIKTLDFKTTFYFGYVFYTYTIRSLGFIISTIIFLSIGFILLKEKNLKKVMIIFVGVSVGFYILLNNILGVYIDPGIIMNFL
jgi:putative tricarboxylic transport membrane protein